MKMEFKEKGLYINPKEYISIAKTSNNPQRTKKGNICMRINQQILYSNRNIQGNKKNKIMESQL